MCLKIVLVHVGEQKIKEHVRRVPNLQPWLPPIQPGMTAPSMRPVSCACAHCHPCNLTPGRHTCCLPITQTRKPQPEPGLTTYRWNGSSSSYFTPPYPSPQGFLSPLSAEGTSPLVSQGVVAGLASANTTSLESFQASNLKLCF